MHKSRKEKTVSRKANYLDKQWAELMTLIQDYADAQQADSWKGGGDPEEYGVIELQYKLARERLALHIARLRIKVMEHTK